MVVVVLVVVVVFVVVGCWLLVVGCWLLVVGCCGVLWRVVACCGVLWRVVACCGVWLFCVVVVAELVLLLFLMRAEESRKAHVHLSLRSIVQGPSMANNCWPSRAPKNGTQLRRGVRKRPDTPKKSPVNRHKTPPYDWS